MGNTYGAYETLIVCGNYEGDLEAIAEVLNGFIFDQDHDPDQRFVVHDGRIQPDRFDIEGVSAAFPRTNDDDYEEVSLAELSRTIAPLLKRRYFGVGFDRALHAQVYPARNPCHPFGWPGATTKAGIRECSA
jgi:hypothetical protein